MSLFRRIFNRLPRPPSSHCKKDKEKSDSVTVLLDNILTAQHVLYGSETFLTWIANAFNCFLVTLSLRRWCAQYGIGSIEELAMAITFTQMSRPLGAFLFGLLADRFGRRWPLTLNLLTIGATVLATAFIDHYSVFLAIHTLFNFFVGGTYGISVAMVLENLPTHTRGFVSGFLELGYYVGYFLAGGVDLIAATQLIDSRSSFYIGSGIAFFVAILCAFCPDSECFIRLRRESYLYPDSRGPSIGMLFRNSLRFAISAHWKRTIYCIILLTGFHGLSHITDDLYQSFATVEKGLSVNETQHIIMIGAAGSAIGALVGGSLSQPLGRRIIMIFMCIAAAGFVPLWILPITDIGLALGYFWFKFCLQGAWGVLPIYISEISPSGSLATFLGITYHLGQTISLTAPLLGKYAGESTRTEMGVLQFGLTQAIFFGIYGGFVVFLLLFGNKKHGIELRSIGVFREIDSENR